MQMGDGVRQGTVKTAIRVVQSEGLAGRIVEVNAVPFHTMVYSLDENRS